MHSHKILNIAPVNDSLQETLSRQLGISGILAQLLINRGVGNCDAAAGFLNAGTDVLRDPFAFSGMEKAVALLTEARHHGRRVMVYGDYDADGITSLALLKTVLKKHGFDAVHYLPHRVKEGYGLIDDIDQVAAAQGVGLLVTADCGIGDFAQISALRRRGIPTIITDHHEPAGELLPEAGAVINPKVKESGYGFRDLAGVGVAYKLCQALAQDALAGELDLVAVGTIADSVPLIDENRVIVKAGLRCLTHTARPGLRALLDISGFKKKEFDTTLVSFILAPRINASGRMDSAESSLSLLMSEDAEEAAQLAQLLERYNRQRQKIEGRIMAEAQDMINRQVNFKEHKVIVVAKENWHHGVLGIVASKLVDRFYRPAVVISLDTELCKGSARSIRNFHMFEALNRCRGLLDNFGGHSHAAGLVITRESIDDFRRLLNDLAHETLSLEDLLPSVDIDMEIALEQITEKAVIEMEKLAPFGSGNPEPLFYTRALRLKGQPRLLSRDTLKFWVTDGSRSYEAIGFGMGSFKTSLSGAESFDMVYTPRIDTWGGVESLILEAKDVFFR